MRIKIKIAVVATLALLSAGLVSNGGYAAPVSEPTSLTGLLGVTWADSPQGEGLPPRLDLYTSDGSDYLLSTDPAVIGAAGGLFALDGAQVTVEGEFDVSALDQNGNPVLVVSSITPSGGASALATVSGSKPWVIIMCRFSDYSAQPHNQAFFQGLFGSTFPGINDYWSRVSYGAVNLNGTTVMPSWVTLPHPRSHYIGGSANLQALTTDCAGLVDASVNFAQFAGVSMMFNAELDGYAWGGSTALNRDGVSIIRATWMPPWGYENQNVLAHEVGHGFGLPHSSGPYNQTYDSPWDVMSAWPPCNGHSDPNYGCIGVETISYHRNLLGWLPSAKVYIANPGSNRQITLERLGQPTNPAGSYLLAIAPIPGSSTRFYTVEARKHIDGVNYNDYEEELIGEAVVIHLVDTTRVDRQAQVVDSDNNGNPKDAGTMWTPGETFVDQANSIRVNVISSTTTGYVINIRSGTTANDNFTAPTVISSFPFSANIDTPTASNEAADPVFACAGTAGFATVWYRFTPGTLGTVQVSTVGSDYDTLLGIWQGSAGNLTPVACDDNSGGNGTSAISSSLAGGTTYYIEVAGKAASGNLNFNLSFTPCYSLSILVSPAGAGTVAASPGPNCNGSYYQNGTAVQLTASPAAQKALGNWSGSITGSSNPATILMSGNRSVTANFIPVAPVLVSPVSGIRVTDLKPTLDWSDVPGATYSVQYSRSSTFSSPTTVNTGVSSYTIAAALRRSTTYYWHVRAKVGGVYSAWTAAGIFVTPNGPPSVPVPRSPRNGTGAATFQPTLDWSDSTNYPTGYQLQVSTDKTFATQLINTTSAGSSYAVPTPLFFNTRYYWRVRAFNAEAQYSNWSKVYSFGTLPAAPTPVSPIGGTAPNTLRPRFTWNVPPGGAKSYTIQIARDPAFTTLIKSASVAATSYTPGIDMPRDQLVYWRVQTSGTFGKSPMSATATFRGANPPTTPSLVQPANLSASPGYRPLFDWADSPTPPPVTPLPYTSATGYQIQVSASSQFETTLIDTSGAISTYTPGSALGLGTYYWHVRSYNAAQQYSNWSPTFKFYTPGGVSGLVLDAITGSPISGVTVQIPGTSLSTTTSASGAYAMTGIPAGPKTVSISAPGKVPFSATVSIANAAMAHLSTALLPSGAPPSQFRVVLLWENGPTDLDSHLWLPSTSPAHLRWDAPGSTSAFPFAALIRDSARPYGVETTRIDTLYAGTYTFGVYNYSNEAYLKTARAIVWVYKGDTLIKTINSRTSGNYRWWRVFYLSGTGTISVSNAYVASAPGSYDKTSGTGPK